jgi:hypothetical protein
MGRDLQNIIYLIIYALIFLVSCKYLTKYFVRVILGELRMALYQEPSALDAEGFGNFSFSQQSDDINHALPIVDNILPQVPPNDHRAATEFLNALTALMDDLQKYQEGLAMVHNLLSRFIPLLLIAVLPSGSHHQKSLGSE